MALINELTNIGNAIREKTGSTELIPLKEMASAIQGISSGTEYTNIVYNEDNTVTLTDKDGVVHTMSCTYEDGKLTGVNYDGKAVELAYNGDVLVNVGKAAVDMSKGFRRSIRQMPKAEKFCIGERMLLLLNDIKYQIYLSKTNAIRN